MSVNVNAFKMAASRFEVNISGVIQGEGHKREERLVLMRSGAYQSSSDIYIYIYIDIYIKLYIANHFSSLNIVNFEAWKHP